MANDEESREQVCYVQNFEQARSLNSQMNQVPVLSVSITGGLWYGAGVADHLSDDTRFGLLLLAGLINVVLSLAIFRIRDVMESYFEKIKAFHPDSYSSGRPEKPAVPALSGYGMISLYVGVMLFAGFLSFWEAGSKYWHGSSGSIWAAATSAVIAMLMFLSTRRFGSK